MRAVVHPSMIKAASSTLLKNSNPKAAITSFVSSYVEREPDRVRKEKDLAGSKRKSRELPPSRPISNPPNDRDIPSKEKKNQRVHRKKKNTKQLKFSTSTLQDDACSVTSSGGSKESDDLSSLLNT